MNICRYQTATATWKKLIGCSWHQFKFTAPGRPSPKIDQVLQIRRASRKIVQGGKQMSTEQSTQVYFSILPPAVAYKFIYLYILNKLI